MGYVDTLEAYTEESNQFRIFCFKETDYVTKIMESWKTLDDLEGANKNRNYRGRDGDYLLKN